MAKEGKSVPNFFGGIDHYDENGRKTGHSEPSFFGGYDHYDINGQKSGHSDPCFFGGYDHYDSSGKKTGHTDPDFFDGYSHYDSSGRHTGQSDPNFLGGYTNRSGSGGCYVATCVYGSYDCPQVWTLRRFRDDLLARTWPGRAFIRTYYAVSPVIVKCFGGTNWFKRMWRGVLDCMVMKLNDRGVEDTPYNDKNW